MNKSTIALWIGSVILALVTGVGLSMGCGWIGSKAVSPTVVVDVKEQPKSTVKIADGSEFTVDKDHRLVYQTSQSGGTVIAKNADVNMGADKIKGELNQTAPQIEMLGFAKAKSGKTTFEFSLITENKAWMIGLCIFGALLFAAGVFVAIKFSVPIGIALCAGAILIFVACFVPALIWVLGIVALIFVVTYFLFIYKTASGVTLFSQLEQSFIEIVKGNAVFQNHLANLVTNSVITQAQADAVDKEFGIALQTQVSNTTADKIASISASVGTAVATVGSAVSTAVSSAVKP